MLRPAAWACPALRGNDRVRLTSSGRGPIDRGMKQILSVLGMVVLTAAAADAQTCSGNTELRGRAHRLSVGGTMADDSNGADVAYGFGSNRFFGSVGTGINRLNSGVSGLSANQTTFAAAFGRQYGVSRALAVCPIGRVGWNVGPNVEVPGLLDVSTSEYAFSGGAQVGIPTGDAESFNVVPTAGLAIVRNGVRVADNILGESVTGWDTYGLANVGVGLRFNRSRMAVVPSISFPFARGFETDPSFGVTFTTSF